MFRKLFVILFAFPLQVLFSQTVIRLEAPTMLDDSGLHLELLTGEPKETVKLPPPAQNEMNIQKKFLNLFYSRDTEADENITITVYQYENEDILYVDKNNDNDLTNDGAPVLFQLSKDSVSFEIISQKDPRQKLKLALFRKPIMADTMLPRFVDEERNLSKDYLKFMRPWVNDFNFEGKSRTFYFDDRVSMRRGKITVDSIEYAIGLFDYTNNGAYNDAEDMIILEDANGKLSFNEFYNGFMFNDIFKIGSKKFKAASIDKYGDYITLEETDGDITYNFADKMKNEALNWEKKDTLREGFWNNKFVSIEGDTLRLSDYKGKLIFINVWGEWCKPCRDEMEDIVWAHEKYKNEAVFLGILTPGDVEKAKKFITDNNIYWRNVLINDGMKEIIKKTGVPLNLLIYPDGVTYIRKTIVNKTILDKIIIESRFAR